MASVTDLTGNALSIVEPAIDAVFTVDHTAPQTMSFVRSEPTVGVTNADALTFRVTFSESMTDVDASDFVVNGSTATVTNVLRVNGEQGTQYDVAVSGGDLAEINGAVGLNFNSSASLTDLAGNLLPLTEPAVDAVFTLDNTGPQATAFVRRTPSINAENLATNADSLVFRATFDEAVSGLDESDFSVTGSTAAVSSVLMVNGSRGKQFDVTVSGGNLASFNGVVGLNWVTSPSVTDLAGNSMAATEPVTDETFVIDNVAPSLLSIARQSADNVLRPAAIIFRATFGEAIHGIGNSAFVIQGGATATVSAIAAVEGSSGKQFDVTVSGGNLAAFGGSVGLNLSSMQALTDAAGNPLPNTEPPIDELFTVTDLLDVTITASGAAVMTVTVVSGRLQVKIGTVTQTLPEPHRIGTLSLTGGTGADSIKLTGLSRSLYPSLTSISLNGAAGNDTLVGSDFGETLCGGLGNDLLTGAGGTDRLVETGNVNMILTPLRMTGLGTDTLATIETASLTGGASGNKLDASAFAGAVLLNGGDGNDTLLGGQGADSLIGGMGDDQLTGNLGDDTLNAGAGNDSLTGSGGNDQLLGGSGSDTALASGATLYVLTDSLLTGDGSDTLRQIEAAAITTAATSSKIDASAFTGLGFFTGGAGADTLIGGLGADAMAGVGGNDTITAGAGDDTVSGGLGNDSISGGAGADRLKGDDNLDTLAGDDGNDTIDGGLHNDSLTGGDGDDSLLGQAGNDTLRGGIGNDTLDGGANEDALLGQDGDDSLLGNIGNDTLLGGAGQDTLKGGLGNDTLIGGFGIDSLDGEAGSDRAVSGQGGTTRGGTGSADLGDFTPLAETIDELFATVFAFE